MRRKQFEVTDRDKIDEILSKATVCRIAMTDNGRPYIIPLNFGYSDNTLYFHSSQYGKKVELLKENSLICFEVDIDTEIIRGEMSCDWTARYRSVIGYGKVEFVTDDAGKREALDIIMAHYGKSSGNIYNEASVEKVLILKVRIGEVTCKEYGYRT